MNKRTQTAYAFNSLKYASTLFLLASWTMISSFSTLTYSGSLYLQKNTRISLDKISGHFYKSRFMFRKATHWTSGGEERRVTRGGAIFLTSCLMSFFTMDSAHVDDDNLHYRLKWKHV